MDYRAIMLLFWLMMDMRWMALSSVWKTVMKIQIMNQALKL
jgi:hypothetical protein